MWLNIRFVKVMAGFHTIAVSIDCIAPERSKEEDIFMRTICYPIS